MAYKKTEPTITSKFPIEVPTHEYYTNLSVYKIWFGSRFFIWKGKSFAQSAESISVMIDRARRLHHNDQDNFLYHVVGYINKNRVTKATIEIVSIADFDDTDWIKFLQTEQNLLTAYRNDPNCLNNNFVAYVPKWMGESVAKDFKSWLMARNKPKKAIPRKRGVHA